MRVDLKSAEVELVFDLAREEDHDWIGVDLKLLERDIN